MKLKQLESLLGTLQQFSNPKIDLEQYPTGSHIASRMLYTAENSFGDVTNKVVADFGCGCGTLGLAASLLGAEYVVGLDIDAQSIEIATANAEDLELEMDFVQCDLRNLGWRGPIVDTVVMNPPFGTRKKGADMDFLCAALKIASQAVYSLHKTTTRELSSDFRSLSWVHSISALSTLISACEKDSLEGLQCQKCRGLVRASIRCATTIQISQEKGGRYCCGPLAIHSAENSRKGFITPIQDSASGLQSHECVKFRGM